MATFVGTQSDFVKALRELVELDYDACEAYEAAINRLNRMDYKQQLRIFLDDHRQHIKELSNLLESNGEEAPTGPSMGKQWLAKGKVVLANLMGDEQILNAMLSNEEDTNTAYERMTTHENKWPQAESILQKGLEDERRHKEWFEKTIEEAQHAA